MTGQPLRDRLALGTALVGPLLVALALVPFRTDLSRTNAALVLVVVVVAVAAFGNRVAGAVAALSAAVWFDFFLTRPYQRFTINGSDDIHRDGCAAPDRRSDRFAAGRPGTAARGDRRDRCGPSRPYP
ncbi:DUF4118 domain-containing protein [Streptomyces sp. NPDC005181]|uniref:DUF4118 domain-containing protein n=1 Tax=Streptomyces sp. NPDC005181 TaxID=3156869 RepID=UPI0033B02B88